MRPNAVAEAFRHFTANIVHNGFYAVHAVVVALSADHLINIAVVGQPLGFGFIIAKSGSKIRLFKVSVNHFNFYHHSVSTTTLLLNSEALF